LAREPAPRRKRRWPWILLGSVVLLLLLATVVVPKLLDVERYRGAIEQGLRSATGWEPELGAIDFSIFGGLALTVSPASLASPEGGSRFDIQSLHVNAELGPLLRGELRVRSIELKRPEIVLVRPSEERGWILPRDRLPEAPPSPGTPGPASTRKREGGAGEPAGPAPDQDGLTILIDEVSIASGAIRLEDRATEPPIALGLSGVGGTLRPDRAHMELGGKLEGGGSVEVDGSWGTTLTARLREVPTDLLQPFLGPDLLKPGGRLSGEIDYTLPASIDGKLSGKDLLLLAGEEPLDAADLEFAVRRGPDKGLGLQSARLSSAGVDLTGTGRLTPDLDLDLAIPAAPIESVLRVARAAVPLNLEVEPPGSAEAQIEVFMPAGGELTYTVRGKLDAAGFRAAEFLPPARELETAFELAPDGALEVRLLQGRVADGPLRGAVRLDSIDPPGTLSFDGELLEAVLGELLDGFVPGSGEKILGAAGLDADLALDLGVEALDARALSGTLALSAERVVLPGWDLEHAIRARVQDKLGGLAGLASKLKIKELRELSGSAEGEADVPPDPAPLFETLVADVEVNTMPWSIRALGLEARGVSATGSGAFDPLEGRVDLRFEARLDEERTAKLVDRYSALDLLVGSDRRLAVPLRLKGALTSPGIDVDLGRVAESRLGGDDTEEKVKGLLKGLLGEKDD
jgi:hypothetical protein